MSKALNADYLIEGYVRRVGDRLRITAQLIESQGESYLWARTFDCVMTEILSLQAEIAERLRRGYERARRRRACIGLEFDYAPVSSFAYPRHRERLARIGS